ncbi:MAG: GAF domain-containing protein [Pseudomonadota bacterium]|nr:GAF domain-containing protein [Pseudomonadota bacterium]
MIWFFRQWTSRQRGGAGRVPREQALDAQVLRLGAAATKVSMPLPGTPSTKAQAQPLEAPDPAPDHQALLRTLALARLDALRHQGDEAYQLIAHMAAQVCDTPIALVSLLDEGTQWFQARVGMALDCTPLEVSFCQHAVAHPGELTVVHNALTDARVSGSPLVLDDPHLRFYAGAPIVLDDGLALGTVCVADTHARDINPAQRHALRTLARHVAQLLQQRSPPSSDPGLQLSPMAH